MAAEKRGDSSRLGRAEVSGTEPCAEVQCQHHELLDAAFECLPFDFWIRDPEERCVVQNAKSREAWGDVRGQHIHEADVDAATLSVWRENNRRALQGETVSEEVELVVADAPRQYYNVIRPVTAGDQVLGIMGVNIDLTGRPHDGRAPDRDETDARLRAEIASRLMTEQRLERSLQALMRAERMAAVGVLAAGVAHEFNNALTTMLGQVELALERPAADRSRELLQRTLRVGRRAATITDSLLAYSSASGMNPRPTDLNEVVRDAANAAQNLHHGSKLEIRLELQPVPAALADPARIHQVLSNLISNAVHATQDREPRRIELSTRADDRRCTVTVADTGHGISYEDLPRIFSPFFTTKGERAPTGSAQSTVKGTGLGLSVAEAIVTDHDGKLSVESQVGVGSRFSFWLPLAQGDGS